MAGVAHTAGHRLRLRLPPDPESARRARRAAVAAVSAIHPELADDVALVACELVTNAVRHAGTLLELRVRGDGQHVRVEVWDASPHLPQVGGVPGSQAAGGRGLLIVQELARAWGAERAGGGKVVWAELASPHPRLRGRRLHGRRRCRHGLPALPLLLAPLLLASCLPQQVGTRAARATGQGQAVTIDATNYAFRPAVVAARAGTPLLVTVRGRGYTSHTFTVSEQPVDVEVRPGAERTVTVRPPGEPGEVRFRCRYHPASGMEGRVSFG